MATVDETENDNKMFGPLLFETSKPPNSPETESEVTCLLCDDTFNLALSFDIFVRHLFEVHYLVIEEVQNIANLPRYVQYWRDKFKEAPIEEIIPAIKIDSSNQTYFLLSTLLKEDKELRHKLKLEHVLEVQEFERTDGGYKRLCLFCKLNFEGTRADFVAHLESQHNLQLGNPQNLVFIEDLVEKIDDNLGKLICIYCSRVFPERNVLKEHMRKKLHKRINPRNTDYDKYFIVNYLEPEKLSKKVQKHDDVPQDDPNNDEEYYDWNEKDDFIICLFCEKRDTNINTLCLHMEADHDFDFVDLTKNFDFYQKVKFVNYVRRQMHNNKCFYCDLSCKSSENLQEHLFEEQHCKIPDLKVFDQPEFYFPTYENDALLYLIDDVED
ncbi:zinc finger protein 277 [Tribolium madens]|uniref:zinc finger protein 277 n=1 Tax=Tribolium madens TaxID=41895 RepID=UPI001CF75D5C|nr:zinc finger protein 277 [Tribolium madens]